MADQMTAGDLTTDHYGLVVSWQPAEHDDILPPRRTAVCDELRRFVVDGIRWVEISDMTPAGGFVGTAYHLDAATPVEVGRRVRKARKRPWSKFAMRQGETWV